MGQYLAFIIRTGINLEVPWRTGSEVTTTNTFSYVLLSAWKSCVRPHNSPLKSSLLYPLFRRVPEAERELPKVYGCQASSGPGGLHMCARMMSPGSKKT